jgi:putative hydrolase of the HAD superfamily
MSLFSTEFRSKQKMELDPYGGQGVAAALKILDPQRLFHRWVWEVRFKTLPGFPEQEKVDQMIYDIQGIFIDLGNTLRMLVKDEDYQAAARQKIAGMLGVVETPEKFCEELNLRYKTYRQWAFENLTEAPEADLWTRWLAPEFPADRVAPLAVELTYQFRRSNGRRVLVDNGREVVIELHRRGYTLGIISNLISSREIPEWIEQDGFTPYFKSVVLSSVFGKRKPDPAIYHEAARQAGIVPSCCAYVGDNLQRDVSGTRAAGFGMVIILASPDELARATITDENRPDIVIQEFRELLELFPGRPESNTPPAVLEPGPPCAIGDV